MSLARPFSRARFPLWVKLAVFGALGVVATHSVHLVLGQRVATRALAEEQEVLGRRIAQLVAAQAAEAVLVNDLVALQEVVQTATAGSGIDYCFIVRDGRVLASSTAEPPTAALVALRAPREVAPVVVTSKGRRYLDLAQPILDGEPGVVRVGIDMDILRSTRRNLAVLLGSFAVLGILAGIGAAFVVGRRVARPVEELLAAADRFDPAGQEIPVEPRGHDEIAVLAERFNLMMMRLRGAHEEQVRMRHKAIATERMVALGSLVAGVAHEVNNPLAGMKTCLRRLRGEELPPETVDEYLELLEDGVERVEQVMARLLDFARPRQTTLDAVSLDDLAREGAALLQPLLHKRRITLHQVRDGGDAACALADRKQVGQALMNLLLNAIYVTADGGAIRLRVRGRPGQCGLAVEDDGPGIPPAIRHRIADPFFSTKPEGEGTGLGLSVTRTIAEAHGGELSFEFPEQGTVATIWLRAANVDSGRARGSPPAARIA